MKTRLIIAILPFVCFTASCTNVRDAPVVIDIADETAKQTKVAKLTEEQAIAFAEKFIAQNGYTDLDPDKERLSFESIEWESTIDEMLKMRYDTLEKRAFGVARKRKGGEPGWTVAFKYKNRSDSTTRRNGRAVMIDPDGNNGRVEHVDIILAKIDKKL